MLDCRNERTYVSVLVLRELTIRMGVGETDRQTDGYFIALAKYLERGKHRVV